MVFIQTHDSVYVNAAHTEEPQSENCQMRRLLFSLIVLVLLPFGMARAETPVFSEDLGVALKGYDTVAYFTMGKPQKGDSSFAVMWKGVIWHFSTEEHRLLFEANPRAYAPVCGGYCAFAVANGYLMGSDPYAWEIVDGRLFLTYSHAIHNIWRMEVEANIAHAERHWPRVLDD